MKFMKLGSKPDTFRREGKFLRTVATELAPDLIVHIGEVKFYLHKFPLLAKSSRLQRLLGSANDENTDEINIPDIPGGPTAFESCAKFCYGMTVTLNAYNVIATRCAAEYLDMNESVDKGNLIYKIEVFLNSSIFRGWKDSIIVLQTTKSLLPWSEDLKLVTRCIDSIASKASVDPSKVDWSYTYNRKKLPSENGLDPEWNGVRKDQSVPKDWWIEDLCDVGIEFYKRIILAIKAKGSLSSEVIGEALKAYTYKKLSSSAKGSSSSTSEATKNRAMVETVISLLPTERRSVSCSFLLKLLRAVSLLDCSEKSKNDVIKRIGQQLEDALVPDLLIPSTAGQDTVYDIDVAIKIVKEFMMQESSARRVPYNREGLPETRNPSSVSPSSKVSVAKLVDGYLAEVSKDPNLPLSKFISLAEMVAGDSRPVHDALYRAIDTFLKEHQGLSKSERKRLCRLLDCKKLSMDACMHAVQNDRLPLRLVVQVLFEQMRASSASSNCAESGGSYGSSRSVVTTNTEDECVAPTKVVGVGAASERSSSSNNDVKAKGAQKTKMLSKLLLSKSVEDSSSSDTSDSPNSANNDEPKLTPSRTTRYSVS